MESKDETVFGKDETSHCRRDFFKKSAMLSGIALSGFSSKLFR